MSNDLVQRFEQAKKRLENLKARKMKIEASREVAEQKKAELEARVASLGISGSLSDWIEQEKAKLEQAFQTASTEMEMAESQFLKIEEKLRG